MGSAEEQRLRRLDHVVLGVVVGVLFFKLGGVSSAHYGPPKWQPWTWRPGPLFRNTLATGGDMGAHVWAPDFLRRELLPARRLSGWSKDWYAGLPVPTFYFPLPLWTITLLGFVIDPDVAFKLVSVSGLLTLPVVCRLLARRAGLPRLDTVLFALGAFVFVVDPHYAILGGNILSTMAGEFSFSISLSFAVLFLGLLVRLLRTGRGGVALSFALAASAVSHLLPAVFASMSALIIVAVHLVGRRPTDAPTRRSLLLPLAAAAALTLLLIGFWLVPFATNLAYTTDMGWDPARNYVSSLFPPLLASMESGAAVAGGVAILGAIGGLHQLGRFLRALLGRRVPDDRARLGAALGIIAVVAALTFRFMPADRILNERALPFYWFAMSMLAGSGLLSVCRVLRSAWLGAAKRIRPNRSRQRPGAVALLGLASFLTWWGPGFTFGLLPGNVPIPKLGSDGLSVQRARSSSDPGFASEWANYNYNGYQALGKDWTELNTLMTRMREIGRTNGCGRAMWDYEDQLDRYGTSMGMMLLPLFTKGCIGSMEGLYFESSASVPYHFVNASLLSGKGKSSDPVSGVYYPGLDVATGVRKLQQWGVRYYLVFAPDAQAQARTNPDLTFLARTPYHRDCSDDEIKAATCPTSWEVYEVRDAPLVAGMVAEPAVVTGVRPGQTGGWVDVAMAQYQNPAAFPVPLAADGPTSWQRVAAHVGRTSKKEAFGNLTSVDAAVVRTLPSVTVSDVEELDGTVRFRVDRTGVPVVVKESYFPNWKVTGAEGPYRLAPNVMVVIPTATDVELTFSRGRPETVGLAMTFAGLLLSGSWAIARRVLRRRRAG